MYAGLEERLPRLDPRWNVTLTLEECEQLSKREADVRRDAIIEIFGNDDGNEDPSTDPE